MTTVAAVSSVLAGWAPTEWAESWDNVGLLVGDPGAAVGRVLVALDVTDDVLDEAERLGAEMIVAFHPPLFAPLSRVRADEAESRVIWRAVSAGLALYATHTALDAARPGTSDFLAEALGLGPTVPLRPAADDPERGLGRLGELPAPVALG
ncbi:MAG TPA: Nif3-like dinuclear metal center hexameric protein, partial [Armatimonadetes bacterium]|nr:Nif3-like dinuclear metal center hexameric protein [Armatimonadota bacterium]